MIVIFDLEGPLSPLDHAAEAMRVIGKKLGRDDFFEFFKMLSLYDDILVEEGKENYNPGDTLRLIAPIISTHLSNEELVEISKKAALTPGALEIVNLVGVEDVYVASTSYQQHAFTIGERLGLKKEHIYCTHLPTFQEFPYLHDLLSIFEKWKEKGFKVVKTELDKIFWREMEQKFLSTKVCGGRVKEEVVEKVARERNVKMRELIVVGDSITDIHMLGRVAKEGGIAVSFNGNAYSTKAANLAVSSKTLLSLQPIIENFPHIWDKIEEWNERAGGEAHYDDLRGIKEGEKEWEKIVERQKKFRTMLRKEYGELT